MKTLNLHFAEIAKAAFQRHGFASADLAAQWPVIVGDEIAVAAKPDKISWPRKTEEARKLGGTLVLRAQAGRALDVHYQTPMIIERVNQFLGYGAISTIKVIQTADQTLPAKRTTVPMREETKQAWELKFSDVESQELRDALTRLAGQIIPSGPVSTGETEPLLSPPTSSRK